MSINTSPMCRHGNYVANCGICFREREYGIRETGYIAFDENEESETFRLIRYRARMNNEMKDTMQLLLNNQFQMGASKAFDAFLHVYSGQDKFELLEKMKQYLNDEKSRWDNWDVKQEHQ